jgi:NAD(P)-dependent dehydrogenase (short-subunit alcohol dehydrogenase family)
VTDTEISSFAKAEAGRSFILGMQALQRIAEPADIASVVPFLASDDGRLS